MRRSVLSLLVLLPLTLCLSGCGELGFDNWRWHQKLIVEVEVNGKVVQGSAVTSIHWWPNSFGKGGHGGARWLSKVKGEAVVVDLGKGRYLFALLSYPRNTEYIEHLATRSLYKSTKRVWGNKAFARVLSHKGKEPIVVPRDVYPMMVTFEDIADPSSVKQVNPNNLEGTFGPGYKLKSITLEITDEPVTAGKVEAVLGWFYDVNRVVPKANLDEYRRKYGQSVPGKGDFISYKSWRKK